MNWPMLRRRRTPIATGVRKITMTNEIIEDMRSEIMTTHVL